MQSDRELLEELYAVLRGLRDRIEAPEEGLEPQEFADRMHISRRLLYDWMKQGLVGYTVIHHRKGKTVRISTTEVRRLLTPVVRAKPLSSPRGMTRKRTMSEEVDRAEDFIRNLRPRRH